MAGLALIINFDPTRPSSEEGWKSFHASTARLKNLSPYGEEVSTGFCTAAKFDAKNSLHRGITREEKTGSWLLAVGSVVDSGDPQSTASLDTLLHAYLENGQAVLARLEGQFALAIYDGKKSELIVAADPFGLLPVYYGQNLHEVFISTSALAVAKALHSPVDDLRARSFLLYGDMLGGTIWQRVHVLKPAGILRFNSQGMSESQYWQFELDERITRLSLHDSVDCMLETFRYGIKAALEREGDFWVSLTGGLDSRMLASLASFSGLKFQTYCHGPADSRDVRISTEISQKMGWPHVYFPLPDDWGRQRAGWMVRTLGQTDGHLGALKMCRTIREQSLKGGQLGVSLWGYGGEVYRGYYWKQEFWRAGSSRIVNYDALMQYRIIPQDPTVLKDGNRWREQIFGEIQSRYKEAGERNPAWLNTVKLDLIGQLYERPASGITIGAVLGDQRVILPYYFKSAITCVLSINHRWRLQSQLFRRMLERINPVLAGMETADGGPALPMRVGNMHLFAPYWLDSAEKLAWKLGYRVLRRPPWRRRDAGPAGKAYPVEVWLQETLDEMQAHGLLNLDEMSTAAMFNGERLMEISRRKPGLAVQHETLLSRIISLEMAVNYIHGQFQIT